MKYGWQQGYHKRSAHLFNHKSKAGEPSLCGREYRFSNTELENKTDQPCLLCTRALERKKKQE
jgi:hypothetical protein